MPNYFLVLIIDNNLKIGSGFELIVIKTSVRSERASLIINGSLNHNLFVASLPLWFKFSFTLLMAS